MSELTFDRQRAPATQALSGGISSTACITCHCMILLEPGGVVVAATGAFSASIAHQGGPGRRVWQQTSCCRRVSNCPNSSMTTSGSSLILHFEEEACCCTSCRSAKCAAAISGWQLNDLSARKGSGFVAENATNGTELHPELLGVALPGSISSSNISIHLTTFGGWKRRSKESRQSLFKATRLRGCG